MRDFISELMIDTGELIRCRRHLHENPELSGFEYETISFICKKLSELGIAYEEVEKGGILAYIRGGSSKRTVLLRADMDALPIKENRLNLKSEKAVISKTPEASHMCGHDAHTAMLLSAAKILSQKQNELDGTVILCFERAEENGGPDLAYGYEPLLKYLDEQQIVPDSCFALHVSPRLKSGKISAEAGGVFAGNFGFKVRLIGSGGHGSRPDLANNPLDCFAAFYQSLNDVRMREISPLMPLTFSVPVVHMGQAMNVIEDELYFAGTARSMSKESLETFREAFIRNLDSFCKIYRCKNEIELMYLEAPLVNRTEDSDKIKRAIERSIGPESYEAASPSLGSESFAHYVEKYGGALGLLGISNEELGTGAPLHTPEFDIDEAALPYGAAALALYALEVLKPEN